MTAKRAKIDVDEQVLLHAHESNTFSESVVPEIPPITTKVDCCLGIDEAGRGPVCGPMVYGICFVPLDKNKELKALGVADSKTLSEEDRESLFAEIKKTPWLGWMTHILSPADISAGMLGRTNYNLNMLSHDTAMMLIKKAEDMGVRVREVFVDTVGVEEVYEKKLSARFPHLKICVASKADSKFPVVSAASICAKVVRDRVLGNWKYVESHMHTDTSPLGCGYPSDGVTQAWLREHVHHVFGFPSIVRFSWATAKTIIEKSCVAVRWEDDEEDDTPKLMDFVKKKKGGKGDPAARHDFFLRRNLSLVTQL